MDFPISIKNQIKADIHNYMKINWEQMSVIIFTLSNSCTYLNNTNSKFTSKRSRADNVTSELFRSKSGKRNSCLTLSMLCFYGNLFGIDYLRYAKRQTLIMYCFDNYENVSLYSTQSVVGQ